MYVEVKLSPKTYITINQYFLADTLSKIDTLEGKHFLKKLKRLGKRTMDLYFCFVMLIVHKNNYISKNTLRT